VPQAAERKALQKGLTKLDENMVTLAELSELAIRKAIDSLTRLDGDVAREVFTSTRRSTGSSSRSNIRASTSSPSTRPSRGTSGRSRRP